MSLVYIPGTRYNFSNIYICPEIRNIFFYIVQGLTEAEKTLSRTPLLHNPGMAVAVVVMSVAVVVVVAAALLPPAQKRTTFTMTCTAV